MNYASRNHTTGTRTGGTRSCVITRTHEDRPRRARGPSHKGRPEWSANRPSIDHVSWIVRSHETFMHDRPPIAAFVFSLERANQRKDRQLSDPRSALAISRNVLFADGSVLF